MFLHISLYSPIFAIVVSIVEIRNIERLSNSIEESNNIYKN